MAVTLNKVVQVSPAKLATLGLVTATAELVRMSAHSDNVDLAQSLMISLRAAKDSALAAGADDEGVDAAVRQGFYLADISRAAGNRGLLA